MEEIRELVNADDVASPNKKKPGTHVRMYVYNYGGGYLYGSPD